MAKNTQLIWFLVYLMLGLYFINSALLYYKIPEQVQSFDKWIRFVGGVLIILGGINHYLRISYKRKKG